jgi:hydrogenase expression/formation protein HypD
VKYVDEFRSPESVRRLLALIRGRSRTPVCLMEFCGGHTHAVLRFGFRQLLPSTVRLLAGPGCPVCVTSPADLDRAIAVARTRGVTLATFGDMLRVPGSKGTLQEAKARGADVRVVYSTLDALAIARANPDREVVFLAVGFETTAPSVAAAVLGAQQEGLKNFSILSLHKLTPPAMRAILDSGEVRLSGILGPGHVTTIIGTDAWGFLARDYGIPCAVAGFEPVDILMALHALVDSIERESPEVLNAYTRSARPEGNLQAQGCVDRVFRADTAEWRGLGRVPMSGLFLRDAFAGLDAASRFPVDIEPATEPAGCLCGEVLRGRVQPPDCPLFSRACRPEHPIGPCMVSGEGACAAHILYGEA